MERKLDKNLYKTLGVRKNATAATIKKAFRAKVKKLHPDKGGEAAAYDEVVLAYKILSEETTKRQYDQTGTYDDGYAKDEAAAHEELMRMFDQWLDKELQLERYSMPDGPLDVMRSHVEKLLEQHKGVAERIPKHLAFYDLAEKRLKRRESAKEGLDIFIGTLKDRRLKEEGVLKQLERDCTRFGRMLTILDEYEFLGEHRPMFDTPTISRITHRGGFSSPL